MNNLRRIESFILAFSLILSLSAPSSAAEEVEEPSGAPEIVTEPTENMTETTTETQAPTEAMTEPTEMPEEETTAPTDPTDETEAPMDSSQSCSMSFESPEPMDTFEKVPLYLQTDYPDVPYGSGSVATSGCTMACVSMVAASLSGQEVRPDALARRFNHYEASHIQRLEAASTVLDLNYEKTFQWENVVNALEQDKLVIVLLGKPSKFTASQHTVVLTGITEDGKILVNDPYGPNYKKPALKEGFESGFPPEMLKTGFSGAWIYHSYTPTEHGESRYGELELTEDEKYLMAGIIWLEARGESFEGQQAIAEIILNRYTSGKFGKTITGTIMAQGQFRTTRFLDDARPGELQYKAIEKALYGPSVLPMDVYFFARQATNKNVWGQIGGHVFCYGY